MQKELLAWYQENKRELAFRKNKDAYSIWISEIMAQQTRIEAMLPYYSRFIEKYPDLISLSKADDEELHKVWQGLGYYSRCRNLKKCALVCVERYGGQLPKTKKELETLPGIGSYTAGAIASIAYDENVSAIDGNVIRVFSRLYDVQEDVTKAKGKKTIAALVGQSLPGSAWISAYNQALMELGALLCIPLNPRCDKCPIQKDCQAKDPSSLPIIPKKKERRIVHKTIYIYVYDHTVHVVKRKEKGLLYGLYGFDEVLPEDYKEKIQLKPYSHVFSHVIWNMDAYVVYVLKGGSNFISLKEIEERIAIPSAFQPFLEEMIQRGLV